MFFDSNCNQQAETPLKKSFGSAVGERTSGEILRFQSPGSLSQKPDSAMPFKCVVPMMLLAAGVFSLVALVNARIPVIIDTDVGSDFDDSVAIMLALQNDDLDVRLIVTATNDTTARARIVAKYLLATNRTDVPIGIGVAVNSCRQTLFSWADDVPLDSYQKDHGGVVHTDGVAAMYDVINASAVPVTILAIAPATNFPSLLKRFPDVIHRANIKAMSGSLYRGYGNSSQPSIEYNVAQCASCSRQMYTAGWGVTITPLDTCGVARLLEDSFDTVLGGLGPYSTILVASWVRWCSASGNACSLSPLVTDVFFDAVAATLITQAAGKFMDIETRKVTVQDDGRTVVSEQGTAIQAALTWSDDGRGLQAWQEWLGAQLAKNKPSLRAVRHLPANELLK